MNVFVAALKFSNTAVEKSVMEKRKPMCYRREK